MKVVTQVRLFPSAKAATALEATLRACNAAANQVSRIAVTERNFHRERLQRRVYRDLKAAGLSAQPALHVIRKVANAYLSNPDNDRTCRKFRWYAAQAYDDRCLSWQLDRQTVSIWTVHGRLKHIRFGCSEDQRVMLQRHRKGETKLMYRDGVWLLAATCEIPDPPIRTPSGMLGVDLGIVNIATTSTGTRHAGSHLNRVRYRSCRLRAKLQAKGTRSAKRLLRKRRRKEARYAADTNHRVSKQIVAEAQRTGCGLVLEELKGIRDRVRLRKPQRATLHSWSFHQLGQFIGYKARRAGVVVVFVDPANTSRRCSACGHIDRKNRVSQAIFACRRCGFAGHADVNAAVNLSVRGWAVVNQPHADTCLAASQVA